jgi:prepilin-type N-terminal cleavage/methylation domain-containing protein/prepilin-type processing-associated H-X9-DG protein
MQRLVGDGRRAFTLIELLVVLALVAVLIGLLLPAVQKVREAAARAQCRNNLKQIGLACHNYHDAQQSFPPGYRAAGAYVDGATDTAPGWGWAAFLLPYLEQGGLSARINFALPVEAPANAPAAQAMLKVYLCPSDLPPAAAFAVPDAFGATVTLAAPSSYAACVGGDESDTTGPSGRGAFYRNSRTRLADVTDGTSSTVLVGERAWANANGTWAGAVARGVCRRGALNPCPGSAAGWSPAASLVLAHGHLNNATADTDAGLDDFSSRHAGGSHFAFADGSVRFVRSVPADLADGSYSSDGVIYQALATRASGEVVPGGWAD